MQETMTNTAADTATSTVEEESTPKKRGRKPSKTKSGYFLEPQERAVVDFLTAENETERNKIFNKWLRPAFTTMIESIIRRYNLFIPNEEFDQTFEDTMSFLMTKIQCFDPTKKYKAYSYCGTICKNYLIFKINQFNKGQKRSVSYDGQPEEFLRGEIEDTVKHSYEGSSTESEFLHELTSSTVANIDRIIMRRDMYDLTDDEVRVGKALILLMKNWEDIFSSMGSNKFNKSAVLLFLKENTNMTTKALRDNMRVYKGNYYDTKDKLIISSYL